MARPNEEMDLLGSDDEPSPAPTDAPEPEEQEEGQMPKMSVKPASDGGFEVTLKISGTPTAAAPLPAAGGDAGVDLGSPAGEP